MSYQVFSLLVVVACFALLLAWVLLPSNRQRLESYGQSILDDTPNKTSEATGDEQ